VDFQVQAASVLAGILIWCLVAYSLKRAQLLPSYAILWVGIGAALFLLPTYAKFLRWLSADVFGIVGANHFVYLILFSFLLLYTFYLTQKVCELTNRMERVIVALAVLESSFLSQEPAGRDHISVIHPEPG
jgi:Uncharacterized conserved protein (DUF2304)